MLPDLEAASSAFAEEVEALLRATIGSTQRIVSEGLGTRYVVQPENAPGRGRKVPLMVGREHLGDLVLSLGQELDSSGSYLKTVWSEFVLLSTLDRTPLLRLDYRADMNSEPVSHWQMHAERGAFSHLLARAHAQDPRRVGKPHQLSSIHIPTGGERFRPGLEDFLELLIRDCGVDAVDGWEAAVKASRVRWRTLQLRSAVRDLQAEAADVLRGQGWTVEPPVAGEPAPRLQPFEKW